MDSNAGQGQIIANQLHKRLKASYEALTGYREGRRRALNHFCEVEIPRLYGDSEIEPDGSRHDGRED